MLKIGVVSDTHGQAPEAMLDVFRGNCDVSQVMETLNIDGAVSMGELARPVDLIIHAGDIGELTPLSQNVIDALEAIAPVRAVLGNRDLEGYRAGGELVSEQPLRLDVCGVSTMVIHKSEDLMLVTRNVPADKRPRVRIHGHTHVPKLMRMGSGVMLCPGAIHKPKGDNPRRTVALLYVDDPNRLIGAQIVHL